MVEYNYLIHLIRCVIHDLTPEELPEGASFEKVFQYAMDHDIANLAFYAVEKLSRKPSEELYKNWRTRRDLALVRDMHQQFAYEEILGEFASNGIAYKELQGTVIKKLYPGTEYRTMSDLDFIVEKDRLQDCGSILQKLGYKCSTQGDFEIDGACKPDIYVEIHTDYFSEFSGYYGVMGAPFQKAQATQKESLTELYLYNILHTAKHYYSSGCGIRRVLDMYYLDRHCADKIDWVYVTEVLEKTDTLSFAKELSFLAESWFGIGDTAEDTAPMVQQILDAGLHGKREIYINRKIVRNSQDGCVTLGAKLKYICTRVFPGDRFMLIKYPVLRKYRILYPFCWIHRIISMLLGKNRKSSVIDLKLILRAKRDES